MDRYSMEELIQLGQAWGPRAMEPSGGLFPSLVVAGHVVTLAAVWQWRRGRRRAQEEEGKPPPLPGAVTSRRRRPCRREREVGRGGGRLLSPRHFLVPPLPVPSRAAARGRGEAVLPLPPTRTRRPARSLVVGGMRLALGAAWAVRERPLGGEPSSPAARDPVSPSGCQHGSQVPGRFLPRRGPAPWRPSCTEWRQVPPHPRPEPRTARGGSQAAPCPPPQLKVTRSGLQPGGHAPHSTARLRTARRPPRPAGLGDRAAGQRDRLRGTGRVCSGLRPARPGVRASSPVGVTGHPLAGPLALRSESGWASRRGFGGLGSGW
ncbi:hypothetical protein QTO34_007491 [Cnephaeus nilssonii]|uniref:Uncharacterized protein n=1 Tax=Cnephaeus nilssonii TaxID=3371016 RepID=A0AA40LGI8_CNENI|nr:hypothetical protein QTO34_007491 [Eptesicus nilssonii]